MPTTHFYLYKITIEPREDSTFTEFNEMLENLPDNPVTMAKKGHPFQLDGQIRKTGGIHTGTFVLIQKNDLPTKAKFGEEPTSLLNDDDEAGLGHYTSFFYDETNDIIGIQSNRNGVSANGIATYFRRNFKVRDLYLEYIINPDSLDRLQEMSTITSFEISIAKPESGVSFGNSSQSKAFNEMIDIADKSDANTMVLQLGVGFQRNASLKKSGILPLIRSLFTKNQPHEIRKVEIKGREGDEDSLEIIDLVNNKVTIPVEYRIIRTITPRFLNDILKKAVADYSTLKPKMDKTYKVKARRN